MYLFLYIGFKNNGNNLLQINQMGFLLSVYLYFSINGFYEYIYYLIRISEFKKKVKSIYFI